MAKTNFESLRVYQLSETLADEIWTIVMKWNVFARDTVGKQLVRAADSIGSLNETQHFLRRAYKRKLLNDKDIQALRPLVDGLAPKLNSYLKSIGKVPVTA